MLILLHKKKYKIARLLEGSLIKELKSFIYSVMLYGAENLTQRKEHERKLGGNGETGLERNGEKEG